MDTQWNFLCCNGIVVILLLVIWRVMHWNHRFERFENTHPKKQWPPPKVAQTVIKNEPPVDIKPSDRLGQPAKKLNIFATNLPYNLYEASVIKNTLKLERYPNNASLYSNRGAAHLLLQNFDDALHDFNRAIELQPDYADAYSNRGLVHYSQGRYEEAVADYGRAIDILNTDAVYYVNRGQAYRQIGRYEDALTDLNHALTLTPNLPDARKERGLVYYAMGNKEQALTELTDYRAMMDYFMTDRDALKALMDLETLK